MLLVGKIQRKGTHPVHKRRPVACRIVCGEKRRAQVHIHMQSAIISGCKLQDLNFPSPTSQPIRVRTIFCSFERLLGDKAKGGAEILLGNRDPSMILSVPRYFDAAHRVHTSTIPRHACKCKYSISINAALMGR